MSERWMGAITFLLIVLLFVQHFIYEKMFRDLETRVTILEVKVEMLDIKADRMENVQYFGA